MNEVFTKSNLKTGMVVTCRNGEKYVIFLKASVKNLSGRTSDYLINGNQFHLLSTYTNDLYVKDDYHIYDEDFKSNKYDIMKVEQAKYPYDIFAIENNHTILWERNNNKKEDYTMFTRLKQSRLIKYLLTSIPSGILFKLTHNDISIILMTASTLYGLYLLLDDIKY